jgi:hypothetical protein
MEAPLDIGSGDGGVDIHDEHGAAVAWKDVQVIGIELAVLGCEGRIKMMRHAAVPELDGFGGGLTTPGPPDPPGTGQRRVPGGRAATMLEAQVLRKALRSVSKNALMQS